MLSSLKTFLKAAKLNIIKVVLVLILISKIILKYLNVYSKLIRNKLTKKNILGTAKVFCFFMIIYHANLMTKEYLDYNYDYKYNVTNNVGYYLPPISVCTDKDIYYDMNSIKFYFDKSKEFELYNKSVYDEYLTGHKSCLDDWKKQTFKHFYGTPVSFKNLIILIIPI